MKNYERKEEVSDVPSWFGLLGSGNYPRKQESLGRNAKDEAQRARNEAPRQPTINVQIAHQNLLRSGCAMTRLLSAKMTAPRQEQYGGLHPACCHAKLKTAVDSV
jgi:hypothetical protein